MKKYTGEYTMRTALAVIVCRAARAFLKLAGQGGTSLPGRIAEKIDPDILQKAGRGMHIILVTGTNGKTTTCRMLADACERNGERCLLNRSGANLLSGITAEFVCNLTIAGRQKMQCAVIECDEGALKHVTARLAPSVIVVTNLFRDQLDRYGEVMHTRTAILEGIRQAPESTLCLNADCSLTDSLAGEVSNPVLRFGVDVPLMIQEQVQLSDAKYCIHCGAAYEYAYHTYAHLGGFMCPVCGYSRQEPDTAVTAVRPVPDGEEQKEKIQLRAGGKNYEMIPALPGVYNLYNAAAAVCAGLPYGMDMAALTGAVEGAQASFGRMETFLLHRRGMRKKDSPGSDGAQTVHARMILVKNPAGCGQALAYLSGTGRDYDLVLGLNDKTADGTDISWIWDVDYEKAVQDPHLKRILVYGTRAEEMQLRLKYAGVMEKRIVMEKNAGRLAARLLKSTRPVFILPNYTSMLEIRRALQPLAGKQSFWRG